MADPMSGRDDEFVRDSYTWRRPQPWQTWTISAVVAILVIGALIAIF